MQGMSPRPLLLLRCLPVLLLALIAGCSVTPTRQTPAGQTAQAVQLEQQGKFAAAAQIYENLARNAQGQQRATLLVSAAEDWWQVHNNQKAWALLAQVKPANLYPALSARIELLKAGMDLAAQQPEAALKHLAFDLGPLPDSLKARALLLRAQVYSALDDTVSAVADLSAREAFLDNDPHAISKNHQLIWLTLSQARTPPDLSHLPAKLSAMARGWLELGDIARNTWQQPAAYLQQLLAWQSRYPAHPANRDIVADLIAKQRELVAYPAHIAVLLPLNGAYQSVADAVRDGLLTAYYQLAKNNSAPPAITLYDTGGTPQSAQIAYQQAVRDGADMVIGPLTKDAVAALANSGSLPVPVLALNSLDTGRSVPSNLYQFGLPPEDEAAQAADRAVADGFNRAVALVSADDWGNRILNAFTSRFQQLGGDLLGTQTYPPGGNNFSISITRLLNLDQSQYRDEQLAAFLGTHLAFEPRRRQDIQFIFLAARSKDAKLIRPQLKFYHAIDVPVYATSQVYQPSDQANDDLDGISFDDMPWLLENNGAIAQVRNQLAGLWKNNFDANSRLYALGFDAWRLVPLLYNSKQITTPVQGMTGLLSMGSDGRIHRQLDWATFRNGDPRLLKQSVPAPIPTVLAGSPDNP
ncbi:MAG TPA: penicillin-binding protein activator [Gammaproteobacteria bacterium]|nr:penicillin-binding protein activator [Gammaproteobacteria bacterium]